MRVAGLSGDPSSTGLPQTFPLVPLSEALAKRYPFDAMLTMYRIEGETQMPRLNKSALGYLRSRGAKVVADKVLLDIDNPEHRPWQSEDEIAEAYARVKATKLGATAGFYATRAGYRLIWLLPEPLEVGLLESFVSQLIEALGAEGIVADPACCDWTRLFRAPFATREGMTEPLNLPHDFEVGVLDFAPTGLKESRLKMRDTSIGLDWPADPPPPSLPGPEDALPLKSLAPEIYTAIRKGKPIAARDAHHQTMLRALGMLAHAAEEPDPFMLYRVFAQSVVQTYLGDGPGRSKDQALGDLWRAAKSMAATILTERAQKQAGIVMFAGIMQRRVGTFEEPEQVQGTEAPAERPLDTTATDADGFPRDVVLFTSSESCYVIDWSESLAQKEPNYRGPFRPSQVAAMMQRYAEPIISAPGGRRIRTDKGALVSTPELLTRFGGEVQKIRVWSGQRGIRYDAVNKVLNEGCAWVRQDIQPRFHKQIHEFIIYLGGDRAQSLLDVCATVTIVSRPQQIVYLHGVGGAGKTLLPMGLASLYGAVPTAFANAVSTFNDSITQSPIVLADEEIQSSGYGKTTSADVRRLSGNTEHQLHRKFQAPADYIGALRVIVTANNFDALKISEDLTSEDYDALRQRIGYYYCGEASAKFLHDIGGRNATQQWISGGMFAEHLLWLRDNHHVTFGNRFLVEGWESPLMERLGSVSGITSAVIETIAFAISAKAGPVPLEGFLLGNGVIYVSPAAVFDAWEKVHGPNGRVPPKSRVVSALRRLATSDELVTVPYDSGGLESELRAWPLRPKEVLKAIEDYQFGGTERVRSALDKALLWR